MSVAATPKGKRPARERANPGRYGKSRSPRLRVSDLQNLVTEGERLKVGMDRGILTLGEDAQ